MKGTALGARRTIVPRSVSWSPPSPCVKFSANRHKASHSSSLRACCVRNEVIQKRYNCCTMLDTSSLLCTQESIDSVSRLCNVATIAISKNTCVLSQWSELPGWGWTLGVDKRAPRRGLHGTLRPACQVNLQVQGLRSLLLCAGRCQLSMRTTTATHNPKERLSSR